MNSRLIAALAAALITLAASPAFAQESFESSRSMMMEFRVGFFTPGIDEQFKSGSPYADVFGDSEAIELGLHLDYQIWQGFGSLAIGGTASYAWVTGNSLATQGGTATADDETMLTMIPLRAELIYRFDVLALEFGIPVVPYVKGGITAVIWLITDGKDDIATATAPGQTESLDGSGVTFGYHAAAGIQILLDDIAPRMARTFDEEASVNNTYIFAEYMWSDVNDFYTETSINLRAHTFAAGLMFEF